MNLYLDASALVKRYVAEAGSPEVEAMLGEARAVGTAVVSRAEVAAALAKAARVGVVTREAAAKALATFNADWEHLIRLQLGEPLAARAAGIAHVLDGACSNVRDPEGLRVCCEAVRKLGYRGKSVIHPSQIETVNRVFTPTAQELDYYRRVIEAFDAAVARGSAATNVDGKMVAYAMVAMAKRVLAWAGSQKR